MVSLRNYLKGLRAGKAGESSKANLEQTVLHSELKCSQEALTRQNGLFSALMKLLPTGVFMVEAPSGKPLLANEAALALLGRGVLPDASRSNLSDVYKAYKVGSKEPYPLEEMPILRGMKGERTQIDDMLVERPDGSFTRLEITGSPVLDEQGNIWASLVSFVDITERKRVEEELRRNEARQAKMFANIGDVVAIIDAEGINRFKSPNIEKWFGWRPNELLGASAWDNIHPDDHELTKRFMSGLMAVPNTAGRLECRYRCKDGSYKWTKVVAVNLAHDADIGGILLNYHDISARKQAELEKATLEAQIQQSQKMDSIGRLAGGVAHDFNNMLAATLLQLNLLAQNETLDGEARQAIQELEEGARRAANLTRQLLLFSRRAPMQLKAIDLNQVVDHLLKMLRRVIGENYSVEFSCRGQIGLVNADEGMIEQVLLNLVVNARDAMPGGGLVRIHSFEKEWSAENCQGYPKRRVGSFVCIEVVDTGCGIPAANLATIFEPFYTTKELGKGTGLGLSTVDGIVTQHKGWVEVQSELGRGSTFQVYLPVYSGPVALEPALEIAKPVLQGTETILLVEDELNVRIVIRRSLEQLGYKVFDASTPAEALPLWREHGGSIKLLLTDMVMPGGVSGLEFTQQLHETQPHLPVIIMSGYCKDLSQSKGGMVQGIDFLQKPFSIPELATAIRRRLHCG